MQLRFYLNGSSAPVSPEDLGIETATLSLLSMAADQLRLSTFASLGQAPLAYGDAITLKRLANDVETTLFVGKVTAVRAAADPTRHAHDIVCLGPWNDLEQIVYKQRAKVYDAAQGGMVYDYASRVILSNAATPVAAMIEDIVAYAVAKGGAGMAATPAISGIAMTLPRDEQEGLTCAGAIKRLLRFFPDATAAFDYATTPPTLTLRRAPDTVSLKGRPTAAVNLAALHDRAIDRVEIEVYRTHTVDGSSYVTLERLRYPTEADAWADGNAKNTLSVPMEMDGRNVAYEKARIETEKLPDGLLNAPLFAAAKLWLQNHIEDLTENIFDWPDDVTVTYQTRRFLRFNDAGEAVYEEKEGAAALVQFPRMALTAIPHWVDTSAEATLTVTFPKKTERRTIGGSTYDVGSTENEVYVLNFTACSAESGNYRRIAEATAAEVCPASLPEALYDSWHTVFVEGSLTLWLGDGHTVPAVGDVVTGYQGEPSGAVALVQGVTLDADGRLELTLGPPEHLSPHDLVELLRGFRTRRPAIHADAQDSGEDPTGLDTGAASAKHSSGRSSALTTKLNLYGANDKTKTVTVDPDVITPASSENPATAATLRKVTLLAYNPDTKKLQPTKAYVLATEPVNDGAEVDVGGGGTLPEKEFLIKTEAAKLQITAGSGSGSSATPPKLKLILPIYNPATPERTDTLTLEADASALKGKDGDPGEPGKDGTFDPGTALSLEVVTGVTYNTSTHKLQMTKRTIQFYGVSAGTQKTVEITTATAHSAEHTS